MSELFTTVRLMRKGEPDRVYPLRSFNFSTLDSYLNKGYTLVFKKFNLNDFKK